VTTRSPGTATVPIVGVTGGVAGVTATYDAMRRLAARYDAAGDRMRQHADVSGRVLVDPDLVESAVLSPATFAEVELRVAAAASGVHGALPASLTCEAGAVSIRATVDAFSECDRIVASSYHALDYSLGRLLGPSVALSLPALVAVGAVSETSVERTVEEHPTLTEHAVDGSGGLLDAVLSLPGAPGPVAVLGLRPVHPTTADAAGEMARLYPAEGRPRVRRRRDLWVGLGQMPPHTVADLMDHLGETDALSLPDQPGDPGTIEMQRLEGRDGSVRWIVYLPGTDDMATMPWTEDHDVRDLATNLHLIAGQDTAYARGIEEAMTRAGIRPHEPVLLAGHSQGGMEAAAMLSRGTPFDVTNVVTAGSPVGLVSGYPAGSHVLSLENRGDVVPLLDGRDNADSVEQVTVRFDDHEASLLGNHRMVHYVRGGAAVDASPDPSVREQVASLRRLGFFRERATATSQVFQITR
jgi:hypothetical protein